MADTIAAISTPQGEGGIGIVRISGDKSLDIMKKLLHPCPPVIRPRYAYYGNICRPESEEVVDEAICFYMKAPHSYTCEDVVEIQAHGGVVSIRLILRAVLEAGARMAEPGEFTKLAFLNGRMDLEQAEAVIDVIKAKSELPLQIAERQLRGRLGTEIRDIREQLRDVLAQMTVNIDFPDEDIEQVENEKFLASLREIQAHIQRLLDTCDDGRIAKEGIKVAIAGKPNVGKSSLMNALLGEERAIVTSIPGTTRDTIEESANIGGIPLVLTDTAGIRDTEDVIEKIGIRKSHEEMEAADLLILVMDGSKALEEADEQELREMIPSNWGIDRETDEAEKAERNRENREYQGNHSRRTNERSKVLVVINKEDLGCCVTEEEVCRVLGNVKVVRTSLLTMEGADTVAAAIREMFASGIESMTERNIITSERHRNALERGLLAASDGISLLESGEAIEICEIPVHNAYDCLGEIIGETAGEEILDTVFSKFCLGK